MKKRFVPLILFFVIINSLVIVFTGRLRDKNVNTDVVLVGNLVLFAVSILTVFIYTKPVKQKKGYGALQSVYTGFMLKFFALIVAAMLYFFFAREINMPAVVICLGLYLIYSVIGTRQAVKKDENTHSHETRTTHSHSHKHK